MNLSSSALLLAFFAVLSNIAHGAPRGSPRTSHKRSLSSGKPKQRKLMSGGKKGGGGTEPQDECDVAFEDPVFLCDLLEVFRNMGEEENNPPASEGFPGLNWELLCDDFEPVDKYICPDDVVVANICTHQRPHNNPAIKQHYCEPLFQGFAEEDFERCVSYCVNYVSKARGGCCDWECAGSND